MLEEAWGEVEHQLGYKHDQRTEFAVARQFRIISGHLAVLDDHFDAVYDRLKYLQARSNPMPDDLLNAENLPSVLEEFECSCQQSEIAGMLDILSTWQIFSVRNLRERARPEILQALRNECKALMKQPPTAFHIVSALIHLPAGASTGDARRTMRSNVQMAQLTARVRDASESDAPDERRPTQQGPEFPSINP